jgi:hypothetical protein
MFDVARSYLADRAFKRSTLGRALEQHTKTYFYSGHTLSWMSRSAKNRWIGEFYGKLVEIRKSLQPAITFRVELANYTTLYSLIQVLCLLEEEKNGAFFNRNPFISGRLHRYIRNAAPNNEELSQLLLHDDELSAEELVSYANSRAELIL